jgi:hypothetical protein
VDMGLYTALVSSQGRAHISFRNSGQAISATCARHSRTQRRHGRCGYVQRDYSFMPANAALRCQSNKAARSSRAHDDGVIGADL